MVAAIEERIARWTLLPVGNGEGLQVLVRGWGGHTGGNRAGSRIAASSLLARPQLAGSSRDQPCILYGCQLTILPRLWFAELPARAGVPGALG